MSIATDQHPSESDHDTLAHVVLQLRDEIIAQAGHTVALQAALDREHEERLVEQAQHALDLAALHREHDSLIADLRAAHVQALADLEHHFTDSTTWGAGRAVTAPLRLAKRIGGRGR